MKLYCVKFFRDGKMVCHTYKKANSKEEAEMMAEFSLMAHYSNVAYDSVKAIEAE